MSGRRIETSLLAPMPTLITGFRPLMSGRRIETHQELQLASQRYVSARS